MTSVDGWSMTRSDRPRIDEIEEPGPRGHQIGGPPDLVAKARGGAVTRQVGPDQPMLFSRLEECRLRRLGQLGGVVRHLIDPRAVRRYAHAAGRCGNEDLGRIDPDMMAFQMRAEADGELAGEFDSAIAGAAAARPDEDCLDRHGRLPTH